MNFLKYTVFLLFICILLCGCQLSEFRPEHSETTATQAPMETVLITPPSTTAVTEETMPSATEAVATVPIFDPYTLIENMSLEELVGQMFLARCPEKNAIQDIEEYYLGGFVLFGRDFEEETPDSIRIKLQQYQQASQIPMLIAVDEEGGTVSRVSRFQQFRITPFLSPRSLYDKGNLDLVFSTEIEKCQLLHSLGINVNLAPVCDVTTEPDAFMYKRSLGQSAIITGAFAAEVCSIMADEQIGSVLKHFPGYGNNLDTHTGIAVDSRSLETFLDCDLVPFRAGIAAGCDGILVSHTIVNAFDSTAPASLSANVIRYLRESLGFEGVIMTDDLVMEAITNQYGAKESAVLAVLAGNDMLCSSEYTMQYEAVLEAVRNGRITRTQLEESVARILHWKHKIGLIID